jgi:hypothetical protein
MLMRAIETRPMGLDHDQLRLLSLALCNNLINITCLTKKN